MKFYQYLWDRRYLLVFYGVLMAFISGLVYLDPKVQIHLENLIYLNLVGLVLLAAYLVWDSFRRNQALRQIEYVLQQEQEDAVHSLPTPTSFEQEMYLRLIKQVYREQSERLHGLVQEKQENLEFITSWVHEVKTPIAACRLVIEDRAGKGVEQIFSSIEEELDKIEAHVERALYYAKVDAFSKDYLIDERQLASIVKLAVKKNAKAFIHKKIKLELERVDLTVVTDQKWLLFIIDQILSNALKYTSPGGTIRIIGEVDHQEIRLVIQDTGMGIRPEDLGRIFEQGFTGTTGREEYQATGMGLYLAKQLAVKLGHELSAESEWGEYTRLIVHFPKLNWYGGL